jgi:cytochrome bd-type quinol oxidase subunit 2
MRSGSSRTPRAAAGASVESEGSDTALNVHLHRPGIGLLTAVEIFVLGSLAAVLVLWAIPAAFGVEWACLTTEGVAQRSADTYADGVTLAGTLGWLLAGVAALFAIITEQRRLAALLPLAWFVAFVLVALAAAAAIGPQLCPAG